MPGVVLVGDRSTCSLGPSNPGSLGAWSGGGLEDWRTGGQEGTSSGTYVCTVGEAWKRWSADYGGRLRDPGTLGPWDPGTLQ